MTFNRQSKYFNLVVGLIVLIVIACLALVVWVFYSNSNKNNDNKTENVIRTNVSDSRIADEIKDHMIEWDEAQKTYAETLVLFPRDVIISKLNDEVPRFQNGRPFARISSEMLYTQDLNYYFYLADPSAYLAGTEFSDETIEVAFNKMVDDSLTLQFAMGQNENLDSEIYNNADKNHIKRSIKVDEHHDALKQKFGETYTVEKVNIWFRNVDIPVMGVEQARQITETKIKDLHARVKSGEITMKEAGDIIKADTSLAEIDKVYMDNAYTSLSLNDHPLSGFLDAEVDKRARALKVGELSEIFVGRDQEGIDQYYDAYFSFMKLTGKDGEGNSLSERINTAKGNQIVTLYLY